MLPRVFVCCLIRRFGCLNTILLMMLWPPPTTPTSNTHIQAAVQLFLFALGKIITHLSVMDESDHANRYTAANLATHLGGQRFQVQIFTHSIMKSSRLSWELFMMFPIQTGIGNITRCEQLVSFQNKSRGSVRGSAVAAAGRQPDQCGCFNSSAYVLTRRERKNEMRHWRSSLWRVFN